MRKKEFMVIGGSLAILIIAWGIISLIYHSKNYGSIRIMIGQEVYGIYPLNEDRIIPIGKTNVCQIEEGKARMIVADCPDHICMHLGPIDEHGGMISCMPNKVVIEALPSDEVVSNGLEIDAVG